METNLTVRRRLALWVFGPIGAGKSIVLSQLPLEHFRRIDQDAELERRLRAEQIPTDTRLHDAEQQERFHRLRAEVARALWDKVPAWRAQGENLAFETTGNKPALLRAEILAGHAQGYTTLGCALRSPLAACLERNRTRARVVAEAAVRSTWADFENAWRHGVYREIFAADTLEIFETGEEAVRFAASWIQGQSAA